MAQENHRSSSNSIECKQIYERQWKVCKIENNKVNSNIQIRSEISGKDENRKFDTDNYDSKSQN